MVVRPRSTSPKPTFNASWIGDVPGKVKSRRNVRRKIVAKFFREPSKAKRSARRSEFWFAIKMPGRRITPRSQKNSGHRTPISPTKQNTESETGRAGDQL